MQSNAPVGTAVGVVDYRDPDAGDGITFLEHTTAGWFSDGSSSQRQFNLNASTGEITSATQTLPAEGVNVTVQARDRADSARGRACSSARARLGEAALAGRAVSGGLLPKASRRMRASRMADTIADDRAVKSRARR